MEARVVHRKSKELAGYTSGQDSITWLLLIFDIIFRLHLMIMIFFDPHSLTSLCHFDYPCTDILIFFLGKRFRAYKFLRHREILNRICSLGRLLLNGDLKTFLYYWLFSVVNITSLLHWHFPSSLTSIRDTFPWFGISLTFWPSFSFPATQNFNFDSSSLSSFCLL